jgi:hypothetical protein
LVNRAAIQKSFGKVAAANVRMDGSIPSVLGVVRGALTCRRRANVGIVTSVKIEGDSKLLLVGLALGHVCRLFCGRQRRQKQGGQDRDNRYNDEEFDQGKRFRSHWLSAHYHFDWESDEEHSFAQ